MNTSTAMPAGLFRRLAAIVYDSLLVAGLLMLATAVLLPFTHGEAIAAGNLPYRAYLTAIIFLYFGISWTRSGQTLGMKAWRIRAQQPDGRALSWRQALIRAAVAVVSWLALGAGFLWRFVDAEHRTWHDMASGTVLVRLPKRRRTATARPGRLSPPA